MSHTLPIHRLVRRQESLRMPQERFLEGGGELWYPHLRPQATPKDGFRGQRHSKISRGGRRCGRCKCANLIVSTEGFTPLQCARQCAQTRSEDHLSPANANQQTNKKRA
jgi:hypothetical protein